MLSTHFGKISCRGTSDNVKNPKRGRFEYMKLYVETLVNLPVKLSLIAEISNNKRNCVICVYT